MALGLRDRQWTWSSPLGNCRKRAEAATVYSIHWPHKGFRLSQQKWPLCYTGKDRMPSKLLKLIISFQENTQGTVQFDGSTSGSFPIKRGVKQRCVLAPTLFGIFFSVVLSSAFGTSEEGVYICTIWRQTVQPSQIQGQNKMRNVLIRELFFADDAALLSLTQSGLQNLVSSLAHAYQEFGLTISLNKQR